MKKNYVLLLLLLLFTSACGKTEGNWTVRTDVPGVRGKACLRNAGGFGTEVFCSEGVFTIPAGKMTPEKNPGPPGFPGEFAPPEKSYDLFRSLEYGESVEFVILSLGAPLIARPGYNLSESRPYAEYFWRLPDGWILGLIAEDELVHEKMLMKMLPDIRRGAEAIPSADSSTR